MIHNIQKTIKYVDIILMNSTYDLQNETLKTQKKKQIKKEKDYVHEWDEILPELTYKYNIDEITQEIFKKTNKLLKFIWKNENP